MYIKIANNIIRSKEGRIKMPIDGSLENNTVDICGRIVEECTFSHEIYGEGFYNLKVAVERLSESEDILPVMVSDRLIDVERLKEGVVVKVSGQLRSYNNYVSSKARLVLTVFAREIAIVDEPDTKNPNLIALNGYVCKPAVYRITPFGREIADVLIAVNRSYGKSDYIPCIAWGRNAKFASKLDIGANIRLWGRIQSRKYIKKLEQGEEERVAYEVSISKLEIVKDSESEEM